MGTRPLEEVEVDGRVVRWWRTSDAPALHRAIADSVEHLRPWMPWAAAEPLRLADREALLVRWDEEWERGESFGLTICDVATGALLGACGLHRRIDHGGLEIGYWIHVDHVRRGHATAAAWGAATAAFAVDEVTHVEIHHDVANVASGAVPARLGFSVVGDDVRAPAAPAEVGRERRWRLDRATWAEARRRRSQARWVTQWPWSCPGFPDTTSPQPHRRRTRGLPRPPTPTLGGLRGRSSVG